MRLGVLSDLHCELEPSGSRWINPYEPEGLDGRLDAALEWFAESRVDLVVLLGDLVQFATPGDLAHVVARVEASAPAPLAAVNGNHDLRLGDDFAARARAHGIRLLHEEPVEVEGVAVTGVAVDRGPTPPQYLGSAKGLTDSDGPLVVASHFPVLSEASRVAAAGLPYAGDLVNRPELEGALRADGRPKLVLCGHVHVRCSTQAGPLLQLMSGAMIEPPFDAAVVDVDAATVRRSVRRFGGIPVTDPVFSPDEELWRWSGDRWLAEQPVAAA